MSADGASNYSQPARKRLRLSGRADHADELLNSVKDLVVDLIRKADEDAPSAQAKDSDTQPSDHEHHSALVLPHPPEALQQLLNFDIPEKGKGKEGLISTAENTLKYSVNTWHQGFLDKLYASPTPVGLAADMLLSAFNTNVHVYDVSPALTLVEKTTCRAMAALFGFEEAFAGGVSQPGGSAANMSSIVIARNNLFPETKTDGHSGRKFVLFTSDHGHYSVEKAAQICGFGSNAVRSVAVDERGCMRPEALEAAIIKAKKDGEVPFYVNATAGTTVLGSFDPLDSIADICQKYNLWMHVDGSWGGSIIFSEKQRYKLKGIERADSIAICPHKMMSVPLTCSLLLSKDLREFHKAMTLPAGYLFHNNSEAESFGDTEVSGAKLDSKDDFDHFHDLGELVPQCGRRGDSLKLALSWIYYGTSGYAAHIDHAFEMAAYLANLISSNQKFTLVSEDPPPCLQVCFYYNKQTGPTHKIRNSAITECIKRDLVPRGFMIDYAPGDDGKFFRVVVNGQTQKETLDALIKAIEDIGDGYDDGLISD